MTIEAGKQTVNSTKPDESRSGLDPWTISELPSPPHTRGLNVLGSIGPGVILLALAIGSGEWLLGPEAFVTHGLALLWMTVVAVGLQAVFNTELLRYTLYTGEPAMTGFMRTRPSASLWGWLYGILWFFQVGWPAWAGAAAAGIFLLFVGRLPGVGDANLTYLIGVGSFLACVPILVISSRVQRTLEVFSWIMIVFVLGGLLLLCLLFASPINWLGALFGLVGYDLELRAFSFVPKGADWFLLGAFAAYSGAGGVTNLMLTNWARDKGFGMGQVVGYIPAAIGGHRRKLAYAGSTFSITPKNMERWNGWWRIVRVDQYVVFFCGALLGMILPAILYTSFIVPGQASPGIGVAAELASALGDKYGLALAYIVAMLGAWILFKTQLVILEGTVRSVTDLLWSSSRRIREWRGGDARALYYGILTLTVVWGVVALRLTQPIILLQLGANMAGLVFVISSLQILHVNTTLLPVEIRPPLWRRGALVLMAIFYGSFVLLWLISGFLPDPIPAFSLNPSVAF